MTLRRTRRYNSGVMINRCRQVAAALLLTFAFMTAARDAARADVTRFEAGSSPVFFVQLEQGSIAVRTWNQPTVEIVADQNVQIRHMPAQTVSEHLPAEIIFWSQRIRTPSGDLSLPPEPFVLPTLSNAPHEGFVVRGTGNVNLTVPAGTALIVGNVRRGSVSIEGYKNGIFVAHVGAGVVTLDNVSGTGAVQVNNGPVIAGNSDFSRLRVRTGRGNMRFENCNATQIEATSLTGSIMYDNSSFQPGLARFETERGDVILGITGGGVQIGAHSSAGKIFSDGAVAHPGATDQQATIGRGGPVVTATSSTGSVIFYSGALRNHPELERRFAQRIRLSPVFQRTQQPITLEKKFPHDGHIHLKGMLR